MERSEFIKQAMDRETDAYDSIQDEAIKISDHIRNGNNAAVYQCLIQIAELTHKLDLARKVRNKAFESKFDSELEFSDEEEAILSESFADNWSESFMYTVVDMYDTNVLADNEPSVSDLSEMDHVNNVEGKSFTIALDIDFSSPEPKWNIDKLNQAEPRPGSIAVSAPAGPSGPVGTCPHPVGPTGPMGPSGPVSPYGSSASPQVTGVTGPSGIPTISEMCSNLGMAPLDHRNLRWTYLPMQFRPVQPEPMCDQRVETRTPFQERAIASALADLNRPFTPRKY